MIRRREFAELGVARAGAAGLPPIPCEAWDFGRPVQGYAWRHPAPQAAVLVQHGFGVHTGAFVRHYNALVPHLLGLGCSVFGFDMRGHGRSPGRRAATDVAKTVEDHTAARRAIVAAGLPVFVFGHSLGGYVTASSVAHDPSAVAGAIIASAPFPPAASFATRALLNVLAAVAPAAKAPLPAAGRETLTRDPAMMEWLASDPLAYRGLGSTNKVIASILTLARADSELLPRWRAPTLVIHGTADLSTDPEGSRRFFGMIGGTDKTLSIVEGARHELLNDVDRDAVLRTILSWVERRLAGGIPPGAPRAGNARPTMAHDA